MSNLVRMCFVCDEGESPVIEELLRHVPRVWGGGTNGTLLDCFLSPVYARPSTASGAVWTACRERFALQQGWRLLGRLPLAGVCVACESVDTEVGRLCAQVPGSHACKGRVVLNTALQHVVHYTEAANRTRLLLIAPSGGDLSGEGRNYDALWGPLDAQHALLRVLGDACGDHAITVIPQDRVLPPMPGYTRDSVLDPYDEGVGPLWCRADGQRCGVRIVSRHCNSGGIVHGGFLMSFADFAVFLLTRRAREPKHPEHTAPWVTLSMSNTFISPAPLGTFLQARVTVLRLGSTTFARGLLFYIPTCDQSQHQPQRLHVSANVVLESDAAHAYDGNDDVNERDAVPVMSFDAILKRLRVPKL